MKRKLLFYFAVSVLMLIFVNSAFADDISGLIGKKVDRIYDVKLNGTKEIKAISIEGTSYTPLRESGSLFGYDVDFKDNEITVTTKKPEFALVSDEPFYFTGNEEFHFLHNPADPYSVTVTSTDKKTLFAEGKDYRIKDGKISLVSGGKVTVPQTVYVSYSHLKEEPKNYLSRGEAVSNTVKKMKSGKPVSIVFFGDSTTQQTPNLHGIDNHVKVMEKNLKNLYPDSDIKVFNAGISGHTSEDGWNRMEKDVISRNPDLVVVNFGINDYWQHKTVESYQNNMDRILTKLKQIGADIIVRTPNMIGEDQNDEKNIGMQPYNNVLREFSVKYETAMYDYDKEANDYASKGLTNKSDLTGDNIHPNARFDHVISDNLIKFFN